MRKFSFAPSLTLRGRKFKGLRGWAGKPLHPPLTDIPVGAYVLAAGFDLISFFGEEQEWARDFYRAATFTLIGGAIFGVLAALTGFWDWLKSTEKGTQARRTVNAHAWTMVTVTVLGGTIGGSLAYDYGFNVETAGDHPVWHPSDVDVLPGEHT